MNELYTSLEQFKSQYTGVWDPSEEKWFGLDFSYGGCIYRFQTGAMYEANNELLKDGQEAIYGLYKKESQPGDGREYSFLEGFATVEGALESTCIEGVPFSEIILDERTIFLGQD